MLERSLLLSALPWTALGLQAWWLCLAQSLAVWLSLRSRSRAALPLSLLFAALAGALLSLPDFSRAALTFVVTGPLSLVLAAGTAGAHSGRRWALAFPAGALLLAPSFVGALALLLGLLGLGNPELRSGAQALRSLPHPVWLPARWLLGAGLLLAAFAALPRPVPAHLDRTPIDVVERVTAPRTAPIGKAGAAQQRSAPTPARRPPPPDPSVTTLLNAATLPLLGMLLLCLAILRRGWGRSGERPQLLVVALALALLTALGLFVLGLLLQPQTIYRVVGQIVSPAATPELVPGSGGAARRPPAAPLMLPDWLIWSVSVVGLLLLSGAAWFVLRLKEAPDEQEAAGNALGAEPPPTEPLGRVRAAYAATLHLLSERGLSRADHETPDELLTRAAARWPDLAPALAQLTGAYRPVRYGAAADDQQAEAAERGAAEVQAALQDLNSSTSQRR